METILILAWLASFGAGIAGLIKPRWVRLPSRWAVSALLTFSFLFPVAAGEYFPSADVKQEKGATVGSLVAWAICCGAVVGVRLALLARKMALNGVPHAGSGLIEKTAGKWATFIIERQRGQQEPRHAEDQKQEPLSVPLETRKTKGAGLQFNIAQRRKEAAAARPDPASRSFGSEDYYSEIGDEGEHGRIIRTGWNQGPLVFEYADYHGELTVRTIHKWVEYPQYIQGWCEDKEDTRTFRKNRVQTWFGGTETMLRGPKGRSRL